MNGTGCCSWNAFQSKTARPRLRVRVRVRVRARVRVRVRVRVHPEGVTPRLPVPAVSQKRTWLRGEGSV